MKNRRKQILGKYNTEKREGVVDMNDDNNGWIVMLLIFIEIVLLPFTGIEMIMREDAGILTKACGWVLLILGIILWAGVLL